MELEFFEKVVALAKRSMCWWSTTWPMPISSTMAGKRRQFAGTGCTRCGSRVLYAVEKLQHGGLAYRLYGWQQNAGQRPGCIKSYHDYGTFTPLQVAAIAALEGNQQCVRDVAEQYKRRRDVLVKGLHEAGWMVEMPKASMYVWAKIPEPYAAMGSLNCQEAP